ncbi:hypothetical protein Cri9333_3424 [Crinalium epipsammum PCC 9333]|uniref:Uncharacterized protein n=1 Tax=Crinalium epipsammum PCC 9333 TaxID=1173022 RepID=K9W3C5_9CYAN|nr:hypothetical protein Cri9333_3424 [Crinalium epipsammum PCC 9333]
MFFYQRIGVHIITDGMMGANRAIHYEGSRQMQA